MDLKKKHVVLTPETIAKIQKKTLPVATDVRAGARLCPGGTGPCPGN